MSGAGADKYQARRELWRNVMKEAKIKRTPPGEHSET